MIVCICSNVSESCIILHSANSSSVEELIDSLSMCQGCKTCYDTILTIFNNNKQEEKL